MAAVSARVVRGVCNLYICCQPPSILCQPPAQQQRDATTTTHTLSVCTPPVAHNPTTPFSLPPGSNHRFERKGFKLVGLKLYQTPKEVAEEHYKELKDKPFYPKLVEYIVSGPVVAMVRLAAGRKKKGVTRG